MDDFAVRCPRCKQIFSSGSADQLADALIAHVEQEHGHAPPREHSWHESSDTTRQAAACSERRVRQASPRGPALVAGEFSDDWCERVGEVGTDDDVGEPDLLPSSLELLDGGRRIEREHGQRVRLARRSGIGVGG